jgi:predicted hotdog family 3-hydroxylacyl-ACP dehydratase
MHRERIEVLIPHAGRMSLLDAVLDWDADDIRCVSGSHRRADHPLANGGRVHAVAAIEYAAQAVALHEALRQKCADAPRPGVLAGVRNVALNVDRLDDIDSDLVVAGTRLGGDGSGGVYGFEVTDQGGRCLVAGRMTVKFEATKGHP